jgi:hypothetical protein
VASPRSGKRLLDASGPRPLSVGAILPSAKIRLDVRIRSSERDRASLSAAPIRLADKIRPDVTRSNCLDASDRPRRLRFDEASLLDAKIRLDAKNRLDDRIRFDEKSLFDEKRILVTRRKPSAASASFRDVTRERTSEIDLISA